VGLRLFLQTLGWLACIVYSTIPCFWLLIHPHTAFWRARKHSPYLVLLPVWSIMWLALGRMTLPWRRVVLYANPWTWFPAILLFVSGFWIYLQSSKQFTPAQLGGAPEILGNQAPQRLVTTGIRARLRHPVYLAHLTEMLAWSMGTGLAVLFALTVFAILTGAMMIRMEDAELEQRFGEEFREYRSRVPALLPRIF
jgi:protein-S-isoprenylcysteine O-methyltransferase Ste14